MKTPGTARRALLVGAAALPLATLGVAAQIGVAAGSDDPVLMLYRRFRALEDAQVLLARHSQEVRADLDRRLGTAGPLGR